MAKRKIIIGLTGPVGSGCSELAEMFDDDTNNVDRDIDKCALTRILRNEGYIEIDWKGEKVKPVHSKIDSKIGGHFDELLTLNKKIDLSERFAEKKDLQKEQRNTFNNLKEELEFRETLKSLDYLDEYIDFDAIKHQFTRISLSNLIIYNVLCNYHKLPRYDKDFNKKPIIDCFLDVVKQEETEINKILHSIRGLYPKARGLQEIRHLLKRKNLPHEAIDKTAQILRQLVKLSKDIKTIFKKTMRMPTEHSCKILVIILDGVEILLIIIIRRIHIKRTIMKNGAVILEILLIFYILSEGILFL